MKNILFILVATLGLTACDTYTAKSNLEVEGVLKETEANVAANEVIKAEKALKKAVEALKKEQAKAVIRFAEEKPPFVKKPSVEQATAEFEKLSEAHKVKDQAEEALKKAKANAEEAEKK